MKILAIDPGNEFTAWAVLDCDDVLYHGKDSNDEFLNRMKFKIDVGDLDMAVVEMVACYGMSVGREIFETCVMIGRIEDRWSEHTNKPIMRITRPEVKLQLCGTVRAKDANVRAKLIDLYGPGKEAAVGCKARQGPLYGVKGDEWAAIAVGVAWMRKNQIGGVP